ncbi:uncharacterized protein SPAPADRAFT_59628 [Spathaspora passalidarum NRRL Y-27907]|uniref:Very-long-chain (3R)-3-hydroxyacyl-CoA dehydratase n=1 Tax=Spathaspora passalidarum (strain NRRL Y-27907 / 11-Y1) TaxID=619300 RepID=G3AHN0_SPAPN|nr:uncharacterized protein SPAPADRAFT_59628 [Spathaspora passalidarum NRRL Y-27907]EGW34193.1 hypothetical protein SPAPADRAFT_59628 [Spathaspora passalidarum NRRL Y-27907]
MDRFYPLPTNQKVVFFFNSAAATLWFCCLLRFLLLLPLVGRRFLPGGIADFFQVVALLPLIGFLLVKPLLNKKISLSNLWALSNDLKMAWICYGVIFPHPKIAKHTSYSILISAWCVQYFIHYSYHAFRIKTKSSPHFLFWLQYHNFYVIYPMALVAEMILTFLSLGFVQENSIHEIALKATLLSYIPVAYFAWGHLQARKKNKYIEVMNKRRESAMKTAPSAEIATTSGLSPNTQSTELREIN